MAIQLPTSLRPATASAIHAVLAAYDTENLRHSLMAYPARIKAQREAAYQARKAWEDAELERSTVEAEMLLAISTETDERGKAKYSNAEQRAAELQRRKAADPSYLAAAEKVATAKDALNEAQDTLQMLLDEYQSARMVARLISAEMSVISELAEIGEAEEVFVKVPDNQKTLLKEAF